jgi:mRNA interferase RelE/StbE
MNVEFDESFLKSIGKLKDKDAASKLEIIIESVENAKSIKEISNLKKMEGYKSYYRIRMGDYRIGLKLIDNQTFRFILIAHRREIYRYFP